MISCCFKRKVKCRGAVEWASSHQNPSLDIWGHHLKSHPWWSQLWTSHWKSYLILSLLTSSILCVSLLSCSISEHINSETGTAYVVFISKHQQSCSFPGFNCFPKEFWCFVHTCFVCIYIWHTPSVFQQNMISRCVSALVTYFAFE